MKLVKMTDFMYHDYFKEYENDIDLYFCKDDYQHYIYKKENVDAYIKKQKDKNRICLAIIEDNDIIGEIIFKDITQISATLSIALKNDRYKNKGYGTKAEQLAITYAFESFNIKTLYADALLTNMRSQHVLQKVGFHKIREDKQFVYYQITKDAS